MPLHRLFFFFFFNDTATTEIYTLSLHDALPISPVADSFCRRGSFLARHRPGTEASGSPARGDRGTFSARPSPGIRARQAAGGTLARQRAQPAALPAERGDRIAAARHRQRSAPAANASCRTQDSRGTG